MMVVYNHQSHVKLAAIGKHLNWKLCDLPPYDRRNARGRNIPRFPDSDPNCLIVSDWDAVLALSNDLAHRR